MPCRNRFIPVVVITAVIMNMFLLEGSTYVATNADSETRGLEITRKQSAFGGACQPANDLCPIAALVRLRSCQSVAGVLLRSRGAAHGLIGVAWSCRHTHTEREKKKKRAGVTLSLLGTMPNCWRGVEAGMLPRRGVR